MIVLILDCNTTWLFLCQNIEQTCSHELQAACDYCLFIRFPLILLDRIPACLPPELVPSKHEMRINTIILNWPEKWNKEYFQRSINANYESIDEESETTLSLSAFVR